MNVMIVDDDRILCECLLRLIHWEDLNCNQPQIAFNGLEAWELFQKEEIDFVICDLKMPVMSGIDLCRRIRESKIRPEVSVVLLTAYEDFETARQAIQYGVMDYILKPVNDESIQKLEKMVADAADRKETKLLNSSILAGNYNQRLFDAIREKDLGFLEAILEGLGEQELTGVANVCMYLLHVLHDYLCRVYGRNDRVLYDTMYKRWCSDLGQSKTADNCISYTAEQYRKEMEQAGSDSETELVVRRAEALARENFSSQDCSVAWIADQMGLTSGYVGRIFRRRVGVGLMEYITEYRMKLACELLSSGSLGVGEIAVRTGYADSNYFTKAFHGRTGMSPSEYRKKTVGRPPQ